MVTAYTVVSPDGVIGLNGRFYLLDDDDEIMLFKDVIEAQKFIADGGEDPFDEYIFYTEVEEDGKEYALDYDGNRTVIDIGDRCTHCGRDTSFGSVDEDGEQLLLFVNRIPSETDEHSGYMCVECQLVECYLCGNMTLDYSLETGQAICLDCIGEQFTYSLHNRQTGQR